MLIYADAEFVLRAKARRTYHADPSDKKVVSFKKHDVLHVADISRNWWVVQNPAGQTGVAPSNFRELLHAREAGETLSRAEDAEPDVGSKQIFCDRTYRRPRARKEGLTGKVINVALEIQRTSKPCFRSIHLEVTKGIQLYEET